MRKALNACLNLKLLARMQYHSSYLWVLKKFASSRKAWQSTVEDFMNKLLNEIAHKYYIRSMLYMLSMCIQVDDHQLTDLALKSKGPVYPLMLTRKNICMRVRTC